MNLRDPAAEQNNVESFNRFDMKSRDRKTFPSYSTRCLKRHWPSFFLSLFVRPLVSTERIKKDGENLSTQLD